MMPAGSPHTVWVAVSRADREVATVFSGRTRVLIAAARTPDAPIATKRCRQARAFQDRHHFSAIVVAGRGPRRSHQTVR